MVKNSPLNAGEVRDVDSSLGQEDPLEEGMATHSSILARRIPGIEEPGGLQSIELQRVRHDRGDLSRTHTYGPFQACKSAILLRSNIFIQVLHFRLLLTMMATPFLLRDSCLQ